MKILWADIETTGLHPVYDDILATGLVITNEKLEISVQEQWVVKWNEMHFAVMDDFVRKMHTDNGLIDGMKQSTSSIFQIEKEMCDFVKRHFSEDEDVILAGNSIHFDRAFFKHHMGDFYSLLYRRQIDVSSIKVLMKAWAPELQYLGPPAKHLPLSDIYGSIDELRHYKKILWDS